jgi:hypothetical protein
VESGSWPCVKHISNRLLSNYALFIKYYHW